jgi:hypothetical protein
LSRVREDYRLSQFHHLSSPPKVPMHLGHFPEMILVMKITVIMEIAGIMAIPVIKAAAPIVSRQERSLGRPTAKCLSKIWREVLWS